MNNFEKFSSLHRQATPLLLANAWDAASAKIIEQAGAKAIATTSAGVAWSLGYTDGYKMTAKLNADAAQRIARVINVPLSVDFENGYSDDPSTVAENIKPLLDAGVAGINLEDGKDSPDLLAKKIEAIKRVVESHGSGLYINARTDVYLATLVPADQQVLETIRRAKLYAEAGAGGLFVPVITNGEEIAHIAENTSLPLNVMAMPGLPKADRLANLGVKRLSVGTGVSQIAWQATAKIAGDFLTTGDSSVFDTDAAQIINLQSLLSNE
ncbi:isocitrate lyase/phosphoenolpyruvate mutase family protein [Mucilaginibacter corticis]|uniref:Isocitrate lyase/phosphoenolpyruvate mutase family protein n=1 Tax=Mucilaginibacter corticis TaxID=2597670 RepID=A0A556MWR8_9SPHI|nr:isocitrate lyase/phosphoenolpyruvate mutase family protein [Mucilaginibacter corticis]TSJ44357.1 isocitrate lyase/phosphoenolpyruvate mutase family protein [Mucilaginibacter corticis]